MSLTLHVVVHRVDVARFPSVPPGFRWCVSALADPSDGRGWLNAGWDPMSTGAAFTGEQAAATAVHALLLAGVPAQRAATEFLEFDPCPPGAMDVPLLVED